MINIQPGLADELMQELDAWEKDVMKGVELRTK